jgi:hypothetical protein
MRRMTWITHLRVFVAMNLHQVATDTTLIRLQTRTFMQPLLIRFLLPHTLSLSLNSTLRLKRRRLRIRSA